jgi:hypothetical protein
MLRKAILAKTVQIVLENFSSTSQAMAMTQGQIGRSALRVLPMGIGALLDFIKGLFLLVTQHSALVTV